MAPGILRSQLPDHRCPGLGHVNCYFLEDERGVAIVDPGLPGPQSWRALVDRLKRAGYKPKHVHTVVVTHSHPDHFGGAGRLRDTYGAEVITHRSFRTWFDPQRGRGARRPEPRRATSRPGRRRRSGRPMPWRTDATFRPPLKRRLQVRALPASPSSGSCARPAPTRRVDDAEVITLGRPRVGRAAHARATPTTTSACSTPPTAIVLSGDHVLPTITPHISGLVAGADPLTEFFASLDKVAGLEGVTLALPAHGHPFDDLAGRAHEIRDHHERAPRHPAGRRPASSATPRVEEYSHKLFQPRSWGQMAESETYAHLEHLRETGEVTSRDDRRHPPLHASVE